MSTLQAWCNNWWTSPPITWELRRLHPEILLKTSLSTSSQWKFRKYYLSPTTYYLIKSHAGRRQRSRPDRTNWGVSVWLEARRKRDWTTAGLLGNSPRNDSPAPQNNSAGTVEQRRWHMLQFPSKFTHLITNNWDKVNNCGKLFDPHFAGSFVWCFSSCQMSSIYVLLEIKWLNQTSYIKWEVDLQSQSCSITTEIFMVLFFCYRGSDGSN